MPTIYLARHGETDFNKAGRLQGHTDIPLNEVGRAQAAALAERLAGHRIVRAGASTLLRARQTASICAAALGVPCDYEDEDLRERNYGVFEGLTRDELTMRHAEAFTAWQADNRFVPEGAETYDALANRVRRAIEKLAALDEAADGVLLVSHGGAMRALVFAVTQEFLPPLPNGAVLSIRVEGRIITQVERLDI